MARRNHDRSPSRAIVVGGEHPIVAAVAAALTGADGVRPEIVNEEPPFARLGEGGFRVAAVLPGTWDVSRETPDPRVSAAAFEALADRPGSHVVLVASAAVYEPSHHHAGHLSEKRWSPRRNANPLAGRWQRLERQAAELLGSERLTVLRPPFVPVAGGRDYASRLFTGRISVTLPGYDPSLQVLGLEDLARAVALAVERRPGGAYNLAPDGVIPLHRALRLAGPRRLAVPRPLQRLARRLLARAGRVATLDQVDYIRYPWTVSGEKAERELGFSPQSSSAAAIARLRAASRGVGAQAESAGEPTRYDDFGQDKGYIDFYGRVLFRFVHDHYWRVELDGLENIPRRGSGVMVGIHRGFMPYDGVMTLHALARERGRYPRFLVHPTLVKFPFLANFITKVGGVPACRENADWVLRNDGLVGVYPEGIRGAFSYYRDAYRLRKFGRNEFARMALRNRAPILPFVTLGSAEIYPILAKIKWPWWTRYSEWPCLPITPTFPLLPLPLPSKWHTRFLEPMPVHESYPPEAADDARVVRDIGAQVKSRIQEALDEMRGRRRSIFHGNIFKEEAA